MKHKLCCSVILFLCTLAVFSQPAKMPTKATSPVGAIKPLKVTVVAMAPLSYQYKSDNGHVDISYARSKQPKDDVKPTSRPVNSSRCLTKDEIRGQKIENEIVIADTKDASQILPGAVIDAEMMLKSGEFKYINFSKRKPISISLATNQGTDHKSTVIPKGNNKNVEDDLRAAVYKLISPNNIKQMPSMESSSEVIVSTIQENTGIKIGGSFFYMGIKADNTFAFSSEKYHFMYVYTFEQVCLSVIANTASSPVDLFTENTPMNDNDLYIREVKYGRRLYVLIESEYDLESGSDKLKGNLQWGLVSAKLKQNVKTSSLINKTNIRINTQGGSPVGTFEKEDVQDIIDAYFKKPFKEIDIVPLSYKLTYMDGDPVSLVSDAFLDAKNCLDQDKIKIRISQIECTRVDDSKDDEELYGGVNIFYYNASGLNMSANGITALPSGAGIQIPAGKFTFGTKDAPIILKRTGTKNYPPEDQGKYSVFMMPNLDMKIAIKPYLHEKDNVFNKDDDFITENIVEKTIRQFLLEGSTSPVFEFRHKGSVIKIHFEMIPL